MIEQIEERVNQLNRFLTGPGGFPHCCAIMVFDQNLKLTFTSPMVARLFGTTFMESRETFFKDIFSDHEQFALKKLQQFSTLNEDWAYEEITINHQSRQISRQLQTACLTIEDSSGPSFIYTFCVDDKSQTSLHFFNLFKRAIKLAPSAMAKFSLHKDVPDKLITNQRFDFFDNGLCMLLNTPRAELLNASMASLLPHDQVWHNENIWKMGLNGYLDGYSYYTELLDSSGQIVCTRITPFILNHSEQYRDFLLIFTEVPKDTFASTNAFNADALIAGLRHANIAIACTEDSIITFANDVFLESVSPLRMDGTDLINWLNELSPEYRKPFRKQWDRGIRRNVPFTIEFTLKSDPLSAVSLTVVPQQQKVGSRNSTKLILIGVKQHSELAMQLSATDQRAQYSSQYKEPASNSEQLLQLTKTERRVASLIKTGKSSKDIARYLNISPGTVNIHRKNIRRKLSFTGEKVNLSKALAQFSEL
jgi:DNA-binding CsgD family transcriptional regulator